MRQQKGSILDIVIYGVLHNNDELKGIHKVFNIMRVGDRNIGILTKRALLNVSGNANVQGEIIIDCAEICLCFTTIERVWKQEGSIKKRGL